MPLALSPYYGAVVVPSVTAEAIMTLQIDNSTIDAIVTGMTLEMSGNYQFLHTLNDLVYFYSFGDRVGSLVVTGVGFIGKCGDGIDLGILKVYEYYTQNRATQGNGKALKIVITVPNNGAGQTAKFFGFLTGMRMDVADSQMGFLGYWTLRFEVLPQKT
jgi:hypothetical protein